MNAFHLRIDTIENALSAGEAWRAVAERAGAIPVEIEIVCSDAEEHRRRLESRIDDAPGRGVTWRDVLSREYERWGEAHLRIDTSHDTVEAAVTRIRELLPTAHSQLLTSALPSLLH